MISPPKTQNTFQRIDGFLKSHRLPHGRQILVCIATLLIVGLFACVKSITDKCASEVYPGSGTIGCYVDVILTYSHSKYSRWMSLPLIFISCVIFVRKPGWAAFVCVLLSIAWFFVIKELYFLAWFDCVPCFLF